MKRYPDYGAWYDKDGNGPIDPDQSVGDSNDLMLPAYVCLLCVCVRESDPSVGSGSGSTETARFFIINNFWVHFEKLFGPYGNNGNFESCQRDEIEFVVTPDEEVDWPL